MFAIGIAVIKQIPQANGYNKIRFLFGKRIGTDQNSIAFISLDHHLH